MKKLLSIITMPFLSAFALAQEFHAPAIMLSTKGQTLQVYITAATKSAIRYKANKVAANFTDAKISDFDTIFLMEPPEYAAAVDLFEGRDYEDAKAKFAELKETYKPISALKDNHHTLAAFYEMECMRKLGDYQGLATALQSFVREPLSRDYQLRQLDLYVMWDAVRTESWDKLLTITSERDSEELPGYQRAQVAYCKGLALEKLDRGAEALVAYDVAVSADVGASEEITRNAVFNSLGIYHRDKLVQSAIESWGAADENKNSMGRSRLMEAASLAKFYDTFLAAGKPLTGDYRKFLGYAETEQDSDAKKASDTPEKGEVSKKPDAPAKGQIPK